MRKIPNPGGWSCATTPSGCAEQPREAWPGLGAHEKFRRPFPGPRDCVPQRGDSARRFRFISCVSAWPRLCGTQSRAPSALVDGVAPATPSGCAEQPREAWPGLGAHEKFRRPDGRPQGPLGVGMAAARPLLPTRAEKYLIRGGAFRFTPSCKPPRPGPGTLSTFPPSLVSRRLPRQSPAPPRICGRPR